MHAWWAPDSARRRIVLGLVVYVVTSAVFFALAAKDTLSHHTPWNHYALLAEGWLEGRLDLGGPPPPYTGNNDFAKLADRWFVAFPPFPAVLTLPLVWLGGSAQRVQDGQFFIWLAGIAPTILFLALEKLRRTGRSTCSERVDLALALLFAFGSVYFFTAEQGTVWYAAHVVGAALAALYLLFSLDAERPILAGLMIGFGFMTRTPLLFAVPLFLAEVWRASSLPHAPREEGGKDAPPPPWKQIDLWRALRLCALFGLPIMVIVAVALWHNQARFGSPFDFGYEHLQIRWRGRIHKWGLFDYHYLGRNLSVVLTSLPWLPKEPNLAPFQINAHGLALWVTTPLYLWLLWPRRSSPLTWALWATVLAVAVPTLFYQNTGWVQFGYRFSNDYSVFLFALLAIGGFRFRGLFATAAVWSVAVNAFGALSFGRADYARFYYQDNTQRIVHQPD